MLEDDVQLLKRLFYADGEGLPSQRIIDLCAPLTAVLIVMQLDTGILIANFKQVCHLRASTSMQPDMGESCSCAAARIGSCLKLKLHMSWLI